MLIVYHRNAIRRKEPLRQACVALNLIVPKTASLERLRAALLGHWYLYFWLSLQNQH